MTEEEKERVERGGIQDGIMLFSLILQSFVER